MISANITRAERRAIYERDGFRCALCDSTRYLQIHHHVPRGEGGTNSPHNLITLCSDCHALAHGTNLRDLQDVTQEAIQQACCEYLADLYAPGWNPWKKNPYPCPDCRDRRWCDGTFCPRFETQAIEHKARKDCFSCGREHDCRTKGCAILREEERPFDDPEPP